ncbi:uncharacterized protein L203_104073 [Cryptococcus depauperatus CBS 7841]|uniref:Phosphoglycerate mutase n=1 Tax=Cryptococcus depauperatus CBS 7841 TaxID=1295531 RepID=A0AAJ8JUU0_9TREE
MWFFFVRHGQTEDNVRGIIQGQKDTPLNDYGRFEASRLAQRLEKTKIIEAWSSPLSRARETTEIVLKHHPQIPLQTADGLKERGLGSMEGRRRFKDEQAPEDAEEITALTDRAQNWFDDFLAQHEPEAPLPTEHTFMPNPSKRQTFKRFKQDTDDLEIHLIISHGAWLNNFRRLLLSPRYGFKAAQHVDLHLPCLNTCIMVVECDYKDGRWRGIIQEWANVEHLADVMYKEVKEIADDVQ